ncbi:MAG TPA: histidinol dehydrogenase [Anaerolineales bacterium]|nr:histidinol dehydrogenase [Anaerolineales bacterium]
MIKQYSIDQARETILQRKPILDQIYPDVLIQRTEALFGKGVTPPGAVQQIISSIRNDGDAAILHWSQLLDRKKLERLVIEGDILKEAYQSLSSDLVNALRLASKRIRSFHQLQPIPSWQTTSMGGVLGQRFTPIDRVGVYVPGGTAPLPSSLLMSVIPAQVAGVSEIVICTPPDPHPTILAAAYLCGISKIYTIGGAQAIAAMAFGTQTVPKVDKIVGAGNLFVTLAKQQVFGIVGLDGLAGPTETMIIADHTANPSWVAADLLAQAEHDLLASAILLTTDQNLADAVQVEVARQLETLSRSDLIAQSLENQGGIVLTPDLPTAASLANQFAPEHLCLAVENPAELAEVIRHSGGLFFGEYSFEVLGDYVAGPSHVMPTNGTARYASPLNVLDFVKLNSIIQLDPITGKKLSVSAAEIAQAESLSAHAAAAIKRRDA